MVNAKKDATPKDENPKDPKDPKGGVKGAEESAEDAGDALAAGAAADASKFTRKKILLFVALPLVLVIALGSGAYFMGLFDKLLPAKQLDCSTAKEGDKNYSECLQMQAGDDASLPGAFLAIPDMIVNLSSGGKQPRFLKVSLKLELGNPEEVKKMEPLLPRVVDQFQMYLRELRIDDLRGTSGVYRMKIELLSRVRAAAPNVKVRDVLFQEILVQ